MKYSRSASTPPCAVALGADRDGDAFEEDWEYTSIFGMLM